MSSARDSCLYNSFQLETKPVSSTKSRAIPCTADLPPSPSFVSALLPSCTCAGRKKKKDRQLDRVWRENTQRQKTSQQYRQQQQQLRRLSPFFRWSSIKFRSAFFFPSKCFPPPFDDGRRRETLFVSLHFDKPLFFSLRHDARARAPLFECLESRLAC